jgi:hypothetical protein
MRHAKKFELAGFLSHLLLSQDEWDELESCIIIDRQFDKAWPSGPVTVRDDSEKLRVLCLDSNSHTNSLEYL